MKRLLAAGLLILAVDGPYDIPLTGTAAVPEAKGTARLVFAPSPFGIAVTADGRASYQVKLELSGLPAPATLGGAAGYVAWAALPDLSRWEHLGTVRNGRTTVGQVDFNKFLFVITAEPDTLAQARTGPVVMRGASPSTWLQAFGSHPMFRGIPPG
ncbi:MAG: hypothetical protein AB7L66_02660 [Gemmatimonadales bacterium]